jgi:hypothetical protein
VSAHVINVTTTPAGVRGARKVVVAVATCSCGITHKWLATMGKVNAATAMRSAHARAGASFR